MQKREPEEQAFGAVELLVLVAGVLVVAAILWWLL
jgi:hypothetical protein